MKTLRIVLLLFIFSLSYVYAQYNVSGRITDAQSGEIIPGVNVILVGTNYGAFSNSQGEYRISNVPSGSYTLRASFVGYTTYNQVVNVNRNVVVNFVMSVDVQQLGEVVVTALGFEKKRDQSGTSSSQVSGATLNTTGESSILSGLSAKGSGINITQTSGDPGASARILIRGQNSLTGNNQPLFVIDGVPVSNSTFYIANANTQGTAQQSRISDLNLDDVASVEVLKGPSAASLWGSRAANGVIVITTKSGGESSKGRVNIQVKSSVSVDDISKTVNLQTEFGQGIGGAYTWNEFRSWGDRISSRSGEADVIDQTGVITQKNSTQIYDHSRSGYQVGYSTNNSVTISGGGLGSQGSYYLNVSHLNNPGILEGNSNYNRTSVRVNTAKEIVSKLTAKATANFIRTTSDRVQTGSNISGINLGLWRTPADFNLNPYQVDYTDPETGEFFENRHRSYRNGNGASNNPRYNNPLWTLNVAENGVYLDRFIGSSELVYSPSSWMDVIYRLGVDQYSERRYALFPVYDADAPGGKLTEVSLGEYQVNSDLILRMFRQFSDEISVTGTFGYNINQRNYDQIASVAEDFILPNQPRNIGSAETRTPSQYRSTIRTSALYTSLDFSIYDQAFVTVTGRSESASTYGEEANKTVFYPSISVAWQLSDLEALSDIDYLSFAKLRFEYGQAGIQPPVYVAATPYEDRSHASSWGPTLNPIGYGGGYAIDDARGSVKIKNELVTEYTFGADLRFFEDRLSIGVTRYFTKTTDAILTVDLAPSSGFSSQVTNAGELENNGWEIEFDFDVMRSQDFQWTFGGNWFTNKSLVTSLSTTNEIGLAGFTGITSSLIVGQPYGAFFGDRWERDDNGELVFTDSNEDGKLSGAELFPTIAATEGFLGDPNPDWRASIRNTFNYKGVSLNVLFDIKQGGVIWNGTKGALAYFGKNSDQAWWTTLEGDQLNLTNYEGETPAEVIADGRNTYVQNDDGTISFRGYIEDFGGGQVLVDERAYWRGPLSGFTGPAELYVEDAGYVRLREVTLSYSLGNSSFQNLTGLQSVDFSVTGRNLALWTNYSGVDPETNLTGPSNGQGLDYFQVPNTRSWVFTVKVNY